MTLLVGIPACTKSLNGHRMHAAPARYADVVLGVAAAVPVLLPPLAEAMLDSLDRLDGLLLPGSPSNVLPSWYGVTEDLTPHAHDPARDATTLPMLRAAVARGMPVLAICRGIQEMNVAFGGTLHQQVHRLPDRIAHDGDETDLEAQFGPRHQVRLSGGLARIIGAEDITVNSVHEQAIDRLADGLVAEAWAPDGTIEGVRVAGAATFAFGVQWHPEWRAAEFPDRKALIAAFGRACQAYRTAVRRAA